MFMRGISVEWLPAQHMPFSIKLPNLDTCVARQSKWAPGMSKWRHAEYDESLYKR